MTVALAGVNDQGYSQPLRVRVSVENVQAEEFHIRVTALALPNSEVAAVWVTWLAHDGSGAPGERLRTACFTGAE
jgi:hypothetical protein